MISKKILDEYYEEYANRPKTWITEREKLKQQIIEQIFEITQFKPINKLVKIAVLGVSNKASVEIHRKIFKENLQKEVEMTTFDIDTKHLEGEKGIIHQDVLLRFPMVPFDLVFSHALLKFFILEEQVLVLKNAFNALAAGGMAMHILHTPELKRTSALKEWQYNVDVPALLSKLSEENIPYKEIRLKVDGRTTVIVTQKISTDS